MQYNDQLSDEQKYDIIKMVGGAWVVYRPVGGIGDAVMIMPALTALKEAIGDDLLVVICIDYIEPIFAHNPSVDIMFCFTEEERGIGKHSECVRRLRNLDCVIYKLHDPCPALQYEAKKHPFIYQSRQRLFAEACNVKFSEDNYNLVLSEELLDTPFMSGLSDRYIVVHPRSHDKWRDYPISLLKVFLSGLVRTGKINDFQVVTVDAQVDPDIKGVRSFVGKPLSKTIGIINGAMMLIGPDSMGVHVSGALGIPTWGIFGPTSGSIRLKYKRAYWADPYYKCDRQYCWYQPCKYRFCMTSLKPKTILSAVGNILSLIEYHAPKSLTQVDESDEILVARFRGIGDVLLTLPALATLKAKTNCEITYLTSKQCAKLLKASSVIDKIIGIDYHHGTDGVEPISQFVNDMDYDYIYNLVNRVDSIPQSGCIARQKLFAKYMKIDIDYDSDWKLKVPQGWKDRARQILRNNGQDNNSKLIVMQITSSGKSRIYPIQRWRQLSVMLKRANFDVAWLSDTPLDDCDNFIINVGGLLRIEEYIGLITLADCFIGSDSSGVHIAGCTDTPAIGLYGSVDPKLRVGHYNSVYAIFGKSRCSPCNDWIKVSCEYTMNYLQCMRNIKAETVFQKVLEVIDNE